ncbi:MAG: glycosyltransferase family 4 protein [Candidatus Polarisedimenticolaceae bacterium]|nr:glycosyltransferase family 4 protein [Candidatus Polarisedimenticolaceae bacterium]
MKFAFVVSLWFPFGGMQRSLLRIAQACVTQGHQVDIYTGEWQGERPEGIGVKLLDTKATTNHNSNDLLAQRFAEAVADGNYDCRVGFTKLPGLDVYYAADPCYADKVHSERSPLYRLLPRCHAFLRQEGDVFKRGNTTELMLIAHQEKTKFIHYYQTESARFHLLPPGINRERLQLDKPATEIRQQLLDEFAINDAKQLLLLVGSRFKTKGVDRVIEAFAALENNQEARRYLLVVGHGKQKPYLRLAKKLGIAERVIFTDSREDVPHFYHAADYLIHAPRSENTGTVLIEAMLCGLPVLVTANCGFAHHISDADAGLVVDEPFEQPQLNQQLAQFVTSDRAADWRKNGPEYCNRVDLYSLIDRAAEIIIQRAEHNRSEHV